MVSVDVKVEEVHQRKEMTDVEGGSCWIDAGVDGNLLGGRKLRKLPLRSERIRAESVGYTRRGRDSTR